VRVYRLGDWPALFAIVLVLDRLSALMLALTAVLGLAALVFSLARWHRAGAHFHPLLQFQLMGLNGAFLTGDLFNLFVFFEVMLAASYGLALHGSGTARVRAGLHYVAINLAASLLFLVAVSVVYGISGTLNMADWPGAWPAWLRRTGRCWKRGSRSSASPSWSRRRCGRSASGCRPPTPPPAPRRRRSSPSSARSASTPCCGCGCCCSAANRATPPASAALG
jgi:hypothetical protein